MLELKCHKVLAYFLNFLLIIYQLPQVLTGVIGLIIFRNFEVWTNERTGVWVIKVDKGWLFGGACFSSGPFVFVAPSCDTDTLRHETGHSKQSIMFGPLFHIIVSIPSVIRFWVRRFGKKSKDWYLSGWPEKSAEKLGKTDRYLNGNK